MTLIRLRYPGKCVRCEVALPLGTQAWWDRASKEATCTNCHGTSPAEAGKLVSGPAGGSAQREYERRRALREQRVRARHPRLGGFLVAISNEPSSVRAWETGAAGERMLGRRLDALMEEGMAVLHDRRIPGTKANVDHVVVAPSGIHVIDAKRYKGQVEKRDKGGLFRSDLRLYVGGRDQTKLVQAMARQVLAVDRAAGDLVRDPPTLVTPVLCFVEAEWPLLAKPIELDGVHITWPKRLIQSLRRPGPLTVEQIDALATRLLDRLPPA